MYVIIQSQILYKNKEFTNDFVTEKDLVFNSHCLRKNISYLRFFL